MVLPWQWLLDGLGLILARIYDVIPSYGVAIISLTIIIKIVLFPLQWKQIRSMQHMQAIQPKVKELQKRYKNDKQKIQEEQMKLYKEAGVNPLGGCLPMLLLYPFLIAMFSILRPVTLTPATGDNEGAYQLTPFMSHIPVDSELFHDIVSHEVGRFLYMDLQCTVTQAGTQVPLRWTDPSAEDKEKQSGPLPDGATILDPDGGPLPQPATTLSNLDCGDERFPEVIPYALLLVAMVASGLLMQRQTQKASPPGSQTASQQAMMKYFPLMFAVSGLFFATGLVLYWTVSNLFQLAQQTLMLRAGHIGPDAIERLTAEHKERAASGGPTKDGFMQRWMARAEEAQRLREQNAKERGTRTGGQPGPRGSAGSGKNPRQGGKGSSKGGGKGSSKGGAGGRPGSGGRPSKGAPPGNQLKKKKPDDGGTR